MRKQRVRDTLGVLGFSTLDLNDKCRLLEKDGALLSHMAFGSTRYALYGLYGFYVEVEIESGYDRLSVVAVTPFNLGSRLDKYLALIDLRGILDIA